MWFTDLASLQSSSHSRSEVSDGPADPRGAANYGLSIRSVLLTQKPALFRLTSLLSARVSSILRLTLNVLPACTPEYTWAAYRYLPAPFLTSLPAGLPYRTTENVCRDPVVSSELAAAASVSLFTFRGKLLQLLSSSHPHRSFLYFIFLVLDFGSSPSSWLTFHPLLASKTQNLLPVWKGKKNVNSTLTVWTID